MEHETGSGWTGSPAQVSDEDNGGNGVDTGHAAADRNEAGTTNEAGTANEADCATGGNSASPASERNEVDRGRVPATSATGEPRVDAALRLLERLPGLPVSDHPQLFEQVHAELSEVLGELDSGSAPGPVGR